MADEKKPKIDLKSRLGKGSAVGTPPPGVLGTPLPGTGVPVPVPPPTPSVVPGVSIPGHHSASRAKANADGSGALAAALAQANAPPAQVRSAPPPQAQRIEVDEMAVQQARRGAQKQGIAIAGVAAIAFLGVGYVAGQAAESGAARAKSKKDAVELATDLTKSRADLEAFATKMEAGRTQLLKERKFPDQLVKDLGAVNIDFDGSKLAGRRFSGFPQEVSSGLFEFITQVQALNDRKRLLQGLLSKMQKPLTEQFNAPAGEFVVSHVVAVSKDPSGNPAGFISALAAPQKFPQGKIDLPKEFTFGNPGGAGNATAPAYTGGDIAKSAAAVYVVPASFNKVCPSETAGAAAQLGAQMSNVIKDIKGEPPAAGDLDPKPGLLERADRLAKGLQNVK